ncbi:GNAT family N-acetyltransferase [Endozoicomonas sp. OPT23]|uniref:GNAT family N-acetyltransferase n=1 Tax=Endozoicomonas sp. OPT23 TaxID=2072845 RepID=UPI001DCBD412|nr:GNAT family N-acetyltransferase [Endozoicomonas sp. OPT23]
MEIIRGNEGNAEELASIISISNTDVAKLFSITKENNPKHPSFYTRDWVLSDMERGEQYFLFLKNGIAIGCVAVEFPNSEVSYLNRLSVLPKHRSNGVGENLVNYVYEYSRANHAKRISIGIIADHDVLKKWYVKLGFKEGETRVFDHLPFNVTYLQYAL